MKTHSNIVTALVSLLIVVSGVGAWLSVSCEATSGATGSGERSRTQDGEESGGSARDDAVDDARPALEDVWDDGYENGRRHTLPPEMPKVWVAGATGILGNWEEFPRTNEALQHADVGRIPIFYGRYIDRNRDGVFDAGDAARLKEAIEQGVPRGWRGPANLDTETLVPLFHNPGASAQELQKARKFYFDVLRLARETRPETLWGFWNMPPRWGGTEKDEERLRFHAAYTRDIVQAAGVANHSLYDVRRGVNADRMTVSVEALLEIAGGKAVSIPWMNPRRHMSAPRHGGEVIPEPEMRQEMITVWQTGWRDPAGEMQYVDGIALWCNTRSIELDHNGQPLKDARGRVKKTRDKSKYPEIDAAFARSIEIAREVTSMPRE